MATVQPSGEDSTSMRWVDLMEMERSSYMWLDGVTTVTFFEGPVPRVQLEERLVRVVQASPWLAGKLVKRAKKVQMEFDAAPAAERVVDLLFHQIELDVSPQIPFETLVERVKQSQAHVVGGFALLKKGLPYARLTVAQKDAKSWALIFSVSHVVADGYTYYKVLGMLSRQQEIVPLSPTRHHDFVPRVKEAVGPKVYSTVMGSPPQMLNFLGNMLFGGKPRVRAFYVDTAKVEAAKRRNAGGSVEFVSTNDVLTAFWGRLSGADLLEMAVNFRGRFPDLAPDDAGNYEACILFPSDDFADPANIRKALQRGDGHYKSITREQPVPGFNATRKCKYRIITNWASFFSELEFDGCTQTLHVPYLELKEMPTDILVIFRPTAATYGVFIVTRKLSDEALTSREDSLLGAQIIPPAVPAK